MVVGEIIAINTAYFSDREWYKNLFQNFNKKA
jgi:hypothetical protein